MVIGDEDTNGSQNPTRNLYAANSALAQSEPTLEIEDNDIRGTGTAVSL